MTYDIRLIPGDGIGPAIVDSASTVVNEAGEDHGLEIQTTTYPWGAEHLLETGEVMPDGAVDQLRDADGILLGAFGHPDVDNYRVAAEGHHLIRKEFDQYINLRPVYLYNGDLSPLDGYSKGEIDIEWYRENSEGEYMDIGGRLSRGGETEMAVQCAMFTRKGVERIARSAFEAARDRAGTVTNVTKSNALPHGPVYWDEIIEEVAEDYPDVELVHLYADAANLAIIDRPEDFDVVVATNLFSDILTDATAGVVGGLGLAPSSNVNPENDLPGMYEPIHGTAPDIAGEGIANPIATILSGALMLEDLGEDDAAGAIRTAVASLLDAEDGPRTPDLGGDASTSDVTEAIIDRL